MKVSLISTLFNERKSVHAFLEGIFAQSKQPDEVVIVDGGSTDGTVDILREYEKNYPILRVIVDDTCNLRVTNSPIAKGRNVAITAATGDIIAATDAGCKADIDWFRQITAPFERDPSVDVVAGWYEPWIETEFEKATANIMFSPTREEMARDFDPSSRSIAFKKSAWEKAGGYPMSVRLSAEDTLYNQRLRETGAKLHFEPSAVVYWRSHSSLKSLRKQIYSYSVGDGIAGTHAKMHVEVAIKQAVALLPFLFALVFLSPFWLAAGILINLALFLRMAARVRYKEAAMTSYALKFVVDTVRIFAYLDGMRKRKFYRDKEMPLPG